MAEAGNTGAQQDETQAPSQDVKKAVLFPCITFDEEKSTFNTQLVHSLVEEIEDEEVYVISIAGLARSGKSFFLNLLMNYLDYLNEKDKDTSWETACKAPINGFNWAAGRTKSVTQGIWISLYPRPVHGKRLLLLDCQGTKDKEQSTTKLDSMILFYSLTLSNLQIMNVQGDIEPSDLDTLAACMLSNEQKGEHQAYERLKFLIRDWEDDEENPEQLLELVLPTRTEMVRKSAQTILRAFEDVKVIALPMPGKKVARASLNDNLTIQSVDEDFLQKSKILFQEICSLIGQGEKHTMTGRKFADKYAMLESAAVGSFKSPAEMRMAVLVGEVFNTTVEQFMEKMQEALVTIRPSDVVNIPKFCEKIIEECKRKFPTDERVANYATSGQLEEATALFDLVAEETIKSFEFLFEMKQAEEKEFEMTNILQKVGNFLRTSYDMIKKNLNKQSGIESQKPQKEVQESENKRAHVREEVEKAQSRMISLLEESRTRRARFPPFSREWVLQRRMMFFANKMFGDLGLAGLVSNEMGSQV